MAVVILGLSAAFKSWPMAYAAVVVIGLIMTRAVIESTHSKQGSADLSEETKRRLQDIEARITTIEYGIKTRGF